VVSVLNPDAPIVNTIQYRDTGVILEIQPRISSNSQVVLDIRQEVSDVVQTRTSGIDSPTIQQRSLRSTVSVQSGQTIALGGLIRDRNELGRDGLPILNEIPVAGALFGSRSRVSDRTELVVLLSPSIVASPNDAYAVTEEMRRRMRRLAPDPIPLPVPLPPPSPPPIP
jgi:general secretion pathway protein D